MVKRGKINSERLYEEPEDHELHTAKVLASFGHAVTFVAPSNIKGQHKADIVLDNDYSILWETKAPKGKGKNNMHNIFQEAKEQSKYLIIDLFRAKIPDIASINKVMTEFRNYKSIRHVKIITRSNSEKESEKIIDIIR